MLTNGYGKGFIEENRLFSNANVNGEVILNNIFSSMTQFYAIVISLVCYLVFEWLLK